MSIPKQDGQGEYSDKPLPPDAGRNLAMDLLADIPEPGSSAAQGSEPPQELPAEEIHEDPVTIRQPVVVPPGTVDEPPMNPKEVVRTWQDRFKTKPAGSQQTPGATEGFESVLADVDAALASTAPVEEALGQPGAQATPEISRAFAKLRHETSVMRKTVIPGLTKKQEELAAKLTEAGKKQQELESQVEQRARENAELLEKLGRVSLRESPEFQKKYGERELSIVSRLGTSISRALGLAPEEGLKTARGLLKNAEDPVALAEATRGMDPSIAGMVTLTAADLASLKQEQQIELDNWRQASTAAAIENGRKEANEIMAERARSAELGIEHLKVTEHPALGLLDDNEKAAVFDGFTGWLRQAPLDEIFKAVAEGFISPVLQGRVAELQEELATKESELNALRHAYGVPITSRPSVRTPTAPPPASPAAASPATAKPARAESLHDIAKSMVDIDMSSGQ